MPRIEQMFAFISSDEDEDDEGVIGMSIGGVMMPLVGADIERANDYRTHAQSVATISGKVVRLVHFSQRTEVEVFEP